jgi:hypothetical protein
MGFSGDLPGSGYQPPQLQIMVVASPRNQLRDHTKAVPKLSQNS